MDRKSDNPRIDRFTNKHTYEMLKAKPEIAINEYKFIDDNGEIKKAIRREIVDTRDMLSKVHPKTTKIEYMQQYGTLQENNIVMYKFASPYHDMNDEQIADYVKSVVEGDMIQQIDNQNKTE